MALVFGGTIKYSISKNRMKEPFMTKKTSLRFLLALGNTKVVVLNEQEGLQVYADTSTSRKHALAAERISEALTPQ